MAWLEIRFPFDARGHLPNRAAIQDHKAVGAEIFDHVHGTIHRAIARGAKDHMLRTYPKMRRRLWANKRTATPALQMVATTLCRAGNDIHFGGANELCDEEVRGTLVELARRTDLRDGPKLEHHDLVGECHRFHLVMGHVNHGGAEILVKLGNFIPHLHPQRGVEVRQWLVKKKRRGVTHNGPPDRHALTLPA